MKVNYDAEEDRQMEKACDTIAELTKGPFKLIYDGVAIQLFIEELEKGETPRMAAALVKASMSCCTHSKVDLTGE